MSGHLGQLIAAHGYSVVALIVALESMGVPVPGETALVTAAIYAGTTHQLNVWLLIVAASAGAIIGNNTGFLIGRRFGSGLLMNYGRLVRLNPARLKLGQFLFNRHGGTVVFFGRFVPVLRVLAAVLAGMNCMDWRRFLLFNASGAVVWATGYGLAGYALGAGVERLRGPIAWIATALAATAVALMLWHLRRRESALVAEADRALSVSASNSHEGELIKASPCDQARRVQ